MRIIDFRGVSSLINVMPEEWRIFAAAVAQSNPPEMANLDDKENIAPMTVRLMDPVLTVASCRWVLCWLRGVRLVSQITHKAHFEQLVILATFLSLSELLSDLQVCHLFSMLT